MKNLLFCLSILFSFSAHALDCADLDHDQITGVRTQLDSCKIAYDGKTFDALSKAMYETGFKAIFYNINISHAASQVTSMLTEAKDPTNCMNLPEAIKTVKTASENVKKICNSLDL